MSSLYPKIEQIENEKVISISEIDLGYKITTNKKTIQSKRVVIALNYSKPFSIKGVRKVSRTSSKNHASKK